jgi:hypothetical protein
MQAWHELTELMAYRFSDRPSAPFALALIFVVEGGVHVLNYLYLFLPDGLLGNLLLIVPRILYFRRRVRPRASNTTKKVA